MPKTGGRTRRAPAQQFNVLNPQGDFAVGGGQ
jgi:hypothetical protein